MRDVRGAIVLARKIIDSDIFLNKPDKWFKIWTFILLSANYKDIKNFKRGEVFTTYSEICSYTKATRNEVDHCIRWLKQATQITTRKATRGLYINVVNYNVYQKLNNYKSDTESDNKSDLKAIEERYKSDTINKKVKKDKKDIERVNSPLAQNEVVEVERIPAILTKTFFKGVQDLRESAKEKKPVTSEEGKTTQMFLKELQAKYPDAPKDLLWTEIQKFERYWTEKNKTGKQQLWEMNKTFEVDRRLVTWFGRIKSFEPKQVIGKYQAGKVMAKPKTNEISTSKV